MVVVFQLALLKLFMRGIDSRKLESASMLVFWDVSGGLHVPSWNLNVSNCCACA